MKIKKISFNEEGIVSILVTIVMMIVLTLLVLGLAQIGVSDQQNALKRQLSTEAYYLAESGINYSINNNYTYSGGCSNGGIIIDSTTKASIPCVLSSITNNNLYQLNSGQSKVVPLSGTGNINSINLSWTGSNTTAISGTQCSNSGLTNVASWNCPYPILMVNIVSADLLQSGKYMDTLFKENLTDGIATVYLYPYKYTGDPSTINSINQIIKVDCHSGTSCSVNINPGDITQTLHKFYLRITPIYGSTSITLSGTLVNSGTITSNQTAIDSTGKVGTTSQRLYNRISTSTSINLSNQGSRDQTPLFGIQTTQDLCKNFQGYYNSSTDNVFNTASKTGPNNSLACQ